MKGRCWLARGRRASGTLPGLYRIERQKLFVRALMRQGFDFARALVTPEWVSCTGPRALHDAGQARPGWRFHTLADLEPRTMDGKKVLVRAGGPW